MGRDVAVGALERRRTDDPGLVAGIERKAAVVVGSGAGRGRGVVAVIVLGGGGSEDSEILHRAAGVAVPAHESVSGVVKLEAADSEGGLSERRPAAIRLEGEFTLHVRRSPAWVGTLIVA